MVLGSRVMPSRISLMGMFVSFLILSPIMLLCLGLKCWMTTKAMFTSEGWSLGMLAKKASRGSRPPAEAPMPTTGKAFRSGGSGSAASAIFLAGGVLALGEVVFLVAFVGSAFFFMADSWA